MRRRRLARLGDQGADMRPKWLFEEGLEPFCAQVHAHVQSRAGSDGAGAEQLAFAEYALDILAGAGEVGETTIKRLTRSSDGPCAYGFNRARRSLDVFVVLYTGETPPARLEAPPIDDAVDTTLRFVRKVRQVRAGQTGLSADLHEIARALRRRKERIDRVRCYLLTDAVVDAPDVPSRAVGRLDLSFHLWDIGRLFRLAEPEMDRQPIEVDLRQEFEEPIPCLEAPGPKFEYRTLLAVIPARVLHDLYARHGQRILEANVRSYLQARGSVNRGIRDTILNEPERFLGYNNGVSAIAQNVELYTLDDGTKAIGKIKDFQIVNGGQTTASIFHTARRAKDRLKDVHVQAKILEIAPASFEKFAPLVSRFSNSQNRVHGADFASNDAFHLRLEALSREVGSPPGPDGKSTHWFYERARGQYAEEAARQSSARAKRDFAARYPASQRFTKVDLAKTENIWDGRPHVVCSGADRSFKDFDRRLRQRRNVDVDEYFFQDLVAKQILVRGAEQIVEEMDLGGYHAQTAAYTLAYLLHHSDQGIDLEEVWEAQAITTPVRSSIEWAARYVYGMIANPVGGLKVEEWCKKPACLERVRRMEIRLPPHLMPSLLRPASSSARPANARPTAHARTADDRRQKAEPTVITTVPKRSRRNVRFASE